MFERTAESEPERARRRRPVLHVLGARIPHPTDSAAASMAMPDLSLFPGERRALVGRDPASVNAALATLGVASAPLAVNRFFLSRPNDVTVDVAATWRRDDCGAGAAALRRRWIGRVTADDGPLSSLSIERNVELARRLCGLPRDASTTERRLRLFGIERCASIERLDAIRRRRVAVLRAIAHDPVVVIVDAVDDDVAAIDKSTFEALAAEPAPAGGRPAMLFGRVAAGRDRWRRGACPDPVADVRLHDLDP